jgi:hypothetical protein
MVRPAGWLMGFDLINIAILGIVALNGLVLVLALGHAINRPNSDR